MGQTPTGLTTALAEFVADTTFADLPDAVVARTRLHLLDVFAAGFVGSGLRWSRIVREMAEAEGSNPQASVFGSPVQMSTSHAALVNGAMVGAYEVDHSGHTAHPAGTVMPAALATAEFQHASGQDLVLAAALGYEVVCRIGDAQTRAVEDERGFHNPTANGPFSSAAAVGRLLGLDAGAQASAFGIAGSYSGGLTEYAWDGAMTKRLHLGLATQGGLNAAMLASLGFTGPATILEGRYGYFNAFSPSPEPETLLVGLGDDWRMLTTKIKPYPAHGTTQGLIAAIEEYRDHHDLDPGAIERIHVRGSKARILADRHLDPDPRTHLQAQCSVPFTIAVAIHRDLRDPLQYDESVLADEAIRRTAAQVTWEVVDPPSGDPLIAELELTVHGEDHRLTAGRFRGSVHDPADITDVEDKFRRFSRHLLDGAAQDRIVSMISRLVDIDDVADLAAQLRPMRQPAPLG